MVQLNTSTSHINPYDLASLGTIFVGLTFALLLWFTKKANQAANKFLALALAAMVLWIVHISPIDISLPFQFSLAFGPLVYFYVLKLTRPAYKFNRKDLLHFAPVVPEQFILTNPALPFLAFISVITYLYFSHRLIERYYRRQKFNGGDRYRIELRWLHKLLAGFALPWLLWIPYTAIGYFHYQHQLGVQIEYPFYLTIAAMLIGIAATGYLRPELNISINSNAFLKPSLPAELKQKGAWLKKAMEANQYYQEPELSLSSLADKLGLTTHELSRILNTVLKKSFNDFINEYRVAEVKRKMQDPAYNNMNLLGIAYESGFNSKTTFNRAFKQATGKNPVDYKNVRKKEAPSYNSGPHARFASLISSQETTPKWSPEKFNRNFMFKNYLKVAWRNLSRNKSHTFINIAGLSVGLACSLLILLWVQNEKSIDGFHTDRLFRVYETQHNNGQASGTYDGPGPLAAELPRVFPEIKYAVSMGFGELSTFQVGDKVLRMNGNSAGPDYFKMFNYPLVEGTAENALKSPSSIAISRKMAEEFYGNAANAIGKTIKYQNSKNFIINAVFENLPKNASITFDFLTNWDAFLSNNGWARDMGNNGPACYVMLRKDANAAFLNNKLHDFFDNFYHVNRKRQPFYIDLSIQPYAESYLNNNLSTGKPSGGRIETVRLFSLIAVFILLIACINFMNLTTARSLKRAKEVGVRKAIGALRSSLIGQFISKSMLITVVAVAFALFIVAASLPAFNQITQKQIELPFDQSPFWLKLIAITLVTGLVSGSYPALFLSSFNPVKVLKGTLKLDTGTTVLRKGLVVFQFVLSVILITGTIIVSRQMNYIQSKNLGYDKDNLLYVFAEGELAPKYELFKQELLNKTDIQAVSRITTPPQDIYGSTGAVGWIGQDTKQVAMFTQVTVGYDFLKTMKMPLAAGRDFSKDYPTDTSNFVLNESAAKATGYKDPIGKPFRLFGKPGSIIGIVKDFHFHSMHTAIGPMVFHFSQNAQGAVLIRTQPGKTREAIADITTLCKKLNPAFPPVLYFVDREYQNMYQSEQVINKLSDAFAFLAIFISCLGLLGLAMFTAEQRVKEIGIRKVLGASVSSLFTLLSKEFLLLVIIALLIATPITWYAMNKWLLGFAYHPPLQWWVFAVSGAIIILIALVTVSLQSLKAALMNPIKSLRSE